MSPPGSIGQAEEGALYNSIGQDLDFDELHVAFFTPATEQEWELSGRGLTVEEMVNIVVPPVRPPW
jgi:hypothetical protein